MKDIYLYSALSEGSDQLVARISLKFREISRCVPLPKAKDDYLEDFASDAGRESFQKLLLTADKVIYLSTSDEGQPDYEYLGNYLGNSIRCPASSVEWGLSSEKRGDRRGRQSPHYRQENRSVGFIVPIRRWVLTTNLRVISK
jgi:hypothetical protein